MNFFTTSTLFIRRLSFIFMLAFSSSFTSFGQGTNNLSPGDIMVLQIDETEKFIFVTFVDLADQTTIYFTDCGVFPAGTFINAPSYTCLEGAIKFVADGAIEAGSIFQYGGTTPQGQFSSHTDAVITGSLNFTYEGDQLIVFQDADGAGGDDPAENPTFLFIVNGNRGNFTAETDPSLIGSGGDYPGTSIPTGLMEENIPAGSATALAVGSGGGDFDNVIFNGAGVPFTAAATLEENILAAKIAIVETASTANVSDGVNWLGENDPFNSTYLGFEAILLGAVNILPVELTSFNGRPKVNTIDLQWVTASETNNDYFEVEKSTNGIDFKEMIEIDGRGTTTLESYYNWVDQSPNNGLNYYRLLQVDFDGEKSYSNIIVIEFQADRSEIQVYPNPTVKNLNINLPESWEGENTIFIYDFNGKMINSFTSSFGSITLPVDNIPSGFYRLSATNKSKVLNTSFVKK